MRGNRGLGPAMLLICGGAGGQACGMCSAFLSGSVLVRAGAQPYLGARIVSGDEMIDGVLSPRGLRPLGLWRPASAEGVGGGSIAGAGRKGVGLMMGERAVITSGGSLDDAPDRTTHTLTARECPPNGLPTVGRLHVLVE